MNVIYKKACGVDMHKSFIVAVICDSNSIKPQYLRKCFSTFNNSLIEFRNWLLANNCQNVCMESTGKYYIPVYNALKGHISNVVVANSKWVRCIINKIISQDEFNSDDILKNVDRTCKSSYEDILNAVSGISWVDAQKTTFYNLLNNYFLLSNSR